MLRKQLVAYSTCLMALIFLNACAKTREAFGLNRHQPDEFTTPSRLPLDRPVNSDLVAPKQGAQHRGHVKTDFKAQEIVAGSTAVNQTSPAARSSDINDNSTCNTSNAEDISATEHDLLKQTKADQTSPDIREKINHETLRAHQSESVIRKILYWQQKKEAGDIIDPVEEYTKLHKQDVDTQ